METIKFYIIAFLLLLIFANGISQVLTPKWENCLGGTGWDEAAGIILVDSTYWIVSEVESTDGDISYNHGAFDVWLIQVNQYGNLINGKSFGGSYADGGFTDITKQNDSIFYIVTTSSSEDGDISYNPWPGPTDNIWIMKINKQMDILWETMVGGSRVEELRDIIVTNDGGILLLAFTDSYDGDVTGYHGGYDLWLIKIDSTGQKQWNKCFGGNGLEDGGSVIQTSDGGYMIIGDTDGRGGGNYDTTCNFHNPGSFYSDTWIIKLDSDRNIEWQQCYGGSYHDYANNAIELSDGYIILAGTMSNDGDVSGYHSTPGSGDNGDDIWVFKIDKSGNLLWQKCLGGTYIEWARNIFPTSDGGFMIVGSTDSNDGDVVGFHGEIPGFSLHDIWFAKIDSIGNLIWQYCYGGDLDEMIYRGVWQKSDWDYVLSIATSTVDWKCYPSYPPGGGYNLYDIRISELYDSTMANIITTESENNNIYIYPNPVTNYLNIDFSAILLKNNITVEIINLNGQILYTKKSSSQNLKIDMSNFKKGLYLIRVHMKEKVLTKKIFIL